MPKTQPADAQSVNRSVTGVSMNEDMTSNQLPLMESSKANTSRYRSQLIIIVVELWRGRDAAMDRAGAGARPGGRKGGRGGYPKLLDYVSTY